MWQENSKVELVANDRTRIKSRLQHVFLHPQIMKLMNSILGDKLFNMLMKSTFYGHFVAGEDQVKIVPALER